MLLCCKTPCPPHPLCAAQVVVTLSGQQMAEKFLQKYDTSITHFATSTTPGIQPSGEARSNMLRATPQTDSPAGTWSSLMAT